MDSDGILLFRHSKAKLSTEEKSWEKMQAVQNSKKEESFDRAYWKRVAISCERILLEASDPTPSCLSKVLVIRKRERPNGRRFRNRKPRSIREVKLKLRHDK